MVEISGGEASSDEGCRGGRAVSEGKESDGAREMDHWWDKRIPSYTRLKHRG